MRSITCPDKKTLLSPVHFQPDSCTDRASLLPFTRGGKENLDLNDIGEPRLPGGVGKTIAGRNLVGGVLGDGRLIPEVRTLDGGEGNNVYGFCGSLAWTPFGGESMAEVGCGGDGNVVYGFSDNLTFSEMGVLSWPEPGSKCATLSVR